MEISEQAKARTLEANALYAQGKMPEACAIYLQIYKQYPDLAMAAYNVGVALTHMGAFDDARPYIELAHQIVPQNYKIKQAYSEMLFREGEWLEAWKHWEPLIENPFHGGGAHWQPGDSLFGKDVLVVTAGGYGDIFMLARYVPEVAKQFHCRVSFAPQADLVPVFLRQPSMMAVNMNKMQRWDTWLHMFQFMNLFQMTPETVLWNGPYIQSIPGLPSNRLRVGIRLGAEEKGDAYKFRSVPDSVGKDLLASLDGPDVELIPLTLSNKQIVDWRDTIALISGCDLVISVDTAVLHLAGAMGKTAWALLGDFNDAKWGRGESTPWYPSIKIFRGRGLGYEHSVEQVIASFAKLLYESEKELSCVATT